MKIISALRNIHEHIIIKSIQLQSNVIHNTCIKLIKCENRTNNLSLV